MIKYSVMITYYNRDILLHNTLMSYQYFCGDRDDIEIMILEDKKTVNDAEEHSKLLIVLDTFKDTLNIVHREMWYDNLSCPCSTMDYGVTNIARGEFIIISNPENMLVNDVVSGFDIEVAKNPDSYVVPACSHQGGILHSKLVNFEDYTFNADGKWIQHTVLHPKCKNLNHCTCMKKDNYIAVGGFGQFNGDLRAKLRGVDDLFIWKVTEYYPVVTRDDLVVAHITHPCVLYDSKFISAQKRFLNG